MPVENPTRCIGWLGKIFGHKFHRAPLLDEHSYSSNYCYRCGMPKGGWSHAS